MRGKLDTDGGLLVLRCREGDDGAFDTLLQRWQEPLWRYAHRLTGNEAVAWDVLQEALLVIARDIRKLEFESRFAVWAYGIVRHKAGDWLRKHTRRREREAAFAQRIQLEQEDASWVHDNLEHLGEVLPRLNQADRAVLSLRFEDGLTIEEIAVIFGIPAGTVKSRLHHAKRRLRALMEE